MMKRKLIITSDNPKIVMKTKKDLEKQGYTLSLEEYSFMIYKNKSNDIKIIYYMIDPYYDIDNELLIQNTNN